MHPDDHERTFALLAAHFSNDEPFRLDYRLKHKTRGYRWFMGSGQAERNDKGEPTRMIGSIMDIHEGRKAQERLKEATVRMGLILDHAGEGIYGLDLEGRTTFANKAAEALLGYTAEEMVGELQHQLIHHHPGGEACPRDACNIYAAFKEGQVSTEDKEVFWRKDGTALPVEYTSAPIRDDNGDLAGAVVVFKGHHRTPAL